MAECGNGEISPHHDTGQVTRSTGCAYFMSGEVEETEKVSAMPAVEITTEELPETQKPESPPAMELLNTYLPDSVEKKKTPDVSVYSPRMIGHGDKRDTSWYTEEIRTECVAAGKDTGCHSHVKKDFYMFNRFPKTAELLLNSPGHVAVEPIAAKPEIIQKEYSMSRKMFLYFKWYANKSPSILSKKEPPQMDRSVFPDSNHTATSLSRTFRTNVSFPDPDPMALPKSKHNKRISPIIF